MQQEKQSSSVDLLRGKATFNEEKPWLRITILLIEAGTLIVLAWILKQWVAPIIAAKLFSGINLANIFRTGRGNSP